MPEATPGMSWRRAPLSIAGRHPSGSPGRQRYRSSTKKTAALSLLSPMTCRSLSTPSTPSLSAIMLVVHPLFVATRNRESGELVKVNRVPTHLGISSGDTAAMPNLSHLIAQGENASHMESWIAVEIHRISDEAKAALLAGLTRVLNDVRAAVEDWPRMRQKALEIAESLDRVANSAQIAELRQAKDLLRWLDDGNFTFLGYREYDLLNVDG